VVLSFTVGAWAIEAGSAWQGGTNKPVANGVTFVEMTVEDLDRSIEFYSRVLSFSKVREVEVSGDSWEHLDGVFGVRVRVAWLQLGGEQIELKVHLTPKGRPAPPVSHSNDRWFQHIAVITTDMDRAYSWLRQNKVRRVASSPQRLPEYLGAAAGIRAFSFDDPDGHPLEVLQFPADKGNRKWHQATSRLFVGVDHTAIVASDTEASPRFYRDLLGFRVPEGSETYGSEQEHLNGVFNPRPRITRLRSPNRSGIELLEYLAPTEGKVMPEDERANDLIHHETCLVVDDIELASRLIRQAGVPFISSAVVKTPNAEAGFRAAVFVRDPGGHPMELVER